jgi:heme-degrading monooxygenase HmoA
MAKAGLCHRIFSVIMRGFRVAQVLRGASRVEDGIDPGRVIPMWHEPVTADDDPVLVFCEWLSDADARAFKVL